MALGGRLPLSYGEIPYSIKLEEILIGVPELVFLRSVG